MEEASIESSLDVDKLNEAQAENKTANVGLPANLIKDSLGSPILTNSKEFQIQLPLAEDIARLRSDFTTVLLGTPRDEWDKAYQELFNKYPNVQKYKSIFDVSLTLAKDANDDLNKLWKKYQKSKTDFNLPVRNLETASPEASKKMFKDILGFLGVKPQGQVKAERGTTTLRFTLDKQCFEKLPGNNNWKSASGTMLGFQDIPKVKFPVMLFKKDDAEDKNSIIADSMHESEHVMNNYINASRLIFYEGTSIDFALKNQIKRRENSRGSVDGDVKDELLAFFTVLECLTDYDRDKEGIIKYTDKVIETLSESENDLYYGEYQKYHGHIDRDDYAKKVTGGMKALLGLFNIYKSEYKDNKATINPARMAINVLEQFPLKSWPAVEKFIVAKHNQPQNQL